MIAKPCTLLFLVGLCTSIRTLPAVDFVKDVKPILEAACLKCHNSKKANEDGGEFVMETAEQFFSGGHDYGKEVVKPGDANDSPVHWMTTEPADGDRMPPKNPIARPQRQIIAEWINDGAKWPDGVTLSETKRIRQADVIEVLSRERNDWDEIDRETVRKWVEQRMPWENPVKIELVHGDPISDDRDFTGSVRSTFLLQQQLQNEEKAMEDYKALIPITKVPYEMVAIPGGKFTMGSPETEPGRLKDEGPQREVEVEPFWMGKYEVTWDQFEPFMITPVARHRNGTPERITKDAKFVDLVSSPTTPYVEMSFGMGKGKHPAICMTQHAANKFCQWLSVQTGHFYRLPTEAEWEYACRAGTQTAYEFGDDPGLLSKFAVYWEDKGKDRYEEVGSRAPNRWGLYDMHGNVMEWCLDQYFADAYSNDRKTIPAQEIYPRVARGGSWYDDPKDLRSASRFHSEAGWKILDPQLPKSMWFHTDAQWLGFRIVRPKKIPSIDQMHDAWNSGRYGHELLKSEGG